MTCKLRRQSLYRPVAPCHEFLMLPRPVVFSPTTSGLAIGLGGAALGNLFTSLSDEAARLLLEDTLQSGCRSFDTAPHYGNGLSEQRMGQVLRGVPRESFVLSSKVGRLLLPKADALRDQNGYVCAAIRASLGLLRFGSTAQRAR